MVAAVGGGDEPSFGRPELVFEGAYFTQPMVPNFDAWPDGGRFVTVEDLRPRIDRLLVVQNWFEELDDSR